MPLTILLFILCFRRLLRQTVLAERVDFQGNLAVANGQAFKQLQESRAVRRRLVVAKQWRS